MAYDNLTFSDAKALVNKKNNNNCLNSTINKTYEGFPTLERSKYIPAKKNSTQFSTESGKNKTPDLKSTPVDKENNSTATAVTLNIQKKDNKNYNNKKKDDISESSIGSSNSKDNQLFKQGTPSQYEFPPHSSQDGYKLNLINTTEKLMRRTSTSNTLQFMDYEGNEEN
ncbi:hypothetical protein TKK_0003585 [Trichogramma kaykai]